MYAQRPGARGVERQAARAGVPVLLEKPVGLNAAAAHELVELAHPHRVPVTVGYMNRYRASVRALKVALVGNPPFAVACRWVVGGYDKPWWRAPEGFGGPDNDQLNSSRGHLPVCGG